MRQQARSKAVKMRRIGAPPRLYTSGWWPSEPGAVPDAVSLKAVSISSARSGVVLSSASERERRNDDVERNAPTKK